MGGCSDDVRPEDNNTGGSGGDESDPPVKLELDSPICQDGLCWIAPAPQGNPLLDADTTPEGTTFAVGDHGALLRSNGTDFEGIGLHLFGSDAPTSYGALRAVVALADEDVWMVGDFGLVQHLGPDGLVINGPEVGTSEGLFAVGASGSDDVWVGARRGAVYHFDGSSWTRSLVATEGNAPIALAGMWVVSADEVWALGEFTAGSPHLYRYDGATWSDELVQLDPSEDLVAPGASVALTGSIPGQPILAFEHRVVMRQPDGSYQVIYSQAWGASSTVRVRDAHVDGAGKTWLAFESGSVRAFGAEGAEESDVSGAAFGNGPDDRILVLRAAGGIDDPSAPVKRRIVEPIIVPNGEAGARCAPTGSAAVCLLTGGGLSQLWRYSPDGRREMIGELPGSASAVAANDTGLVAVKDGSALHLVDNGGQRTVTIPDLIEDVAVLDDGRVFFVGWPCAYYEVAAGSSTATTVPLAGATDPSVCGLQRSSSTAVYLFGLETRNNFQDVAVVVRASSGSLLHDAIAPRMSSYPRPVVTADGVPYIAGVLKDGTGEAVFRLEGTTWSRLPTPAVKARLSAYGERVVLQNPDEQAPGRGATVRLIEGAASRIVQMPVHGIVRIVPHGDGLLGITEDPEGAVGSGFVGSSGVGLFSFTIPAP